MSTKNCVVIMEEMVAVFSRQATLSLQDLKQCFHHSGRTFNEEFENYFFQVCINSLKTVYSNFKLKLLLDANNETFMSHDLNAANVNQSVAQANNIHSVVKAEDSSMVSQSKGESNNSILILDSDDEESSPEHPTIGKGRDSAVVDEEATLANGIIIEIDDEPNPSNHAQTGLKKEVSGEPKKEEPKKSDDDIPLILIEANRRIKIASNGKLIGESSSSNKNKNEVNHMECGAKDGNHIGSSSRKEPKLTKPRSAEKSATKVSMAMTSGSNTAAPAQMFSKVAHMYQCQVCEYSAHYISTIKLHVRIHTGEKPYRCNRCGKCFSQLNGLKFHGKVHAKEFAFHCYGCFRGFSQENKKDAHEKCCKLRRYECYVCKKVSFVHKGHLKRHMQTHTGENPFRCEICLKRLSRNEDLKYHLNNVHNRNRH